MAFEIDSKLKEEHINGLEQTKFTTNRNNKVAVRVVEDDVSTDINGLGITSQNITLLSESTK